MRGGGGREKRREKKRGGGGTLPPCRLYSFMIRYGVSLLFYVIAQF